MKERPTRLVLEHKDEIQFFSAMCPLAGVRNNMIGLQKNEQICDRGSTSEEDLDHCIGKTLE